MKMKIKVLGDSHALVFNAYVGEQYDFDVVVVHGATARGSINPNTSTNALNIYKQSLSKKDSDKVLIMLGEVDCGYLIWYKSKFENIDPYIQMQDTIDKLFLFVKNEVCEIYNNSDIIITGSPLPTIKDNTDKRYLAGARSEVDALLKDRMELTLEYNNRLRNISNENGYKYIEITDYILDKNMMVVKQEYLSENLYDHHLNPKKTISFWINGLNNM